MKLPRPRSVFSFSGQLRFLRSRRSGSLINTRGLPALPTELLVEILSHASRIPIPFLNGGPPDVECLERRMMLLTLSRVCRSLRAILLPILWETIEACTPRVAKSSYFEHYSPTRDKYVTKSLMRQLRTITIHHPSLASHVKTINVLIVRFSAETVLPELARCLTLMPNLQTVQILDIWWWEKCYEMYENGQYCKPIFEKAFDGCISPSVRNVLLPSAAISLLKCFPEARTVYLNDTPKPEIHIAEFVQGVAEHCPLVEQFDWDVGLDAMTAVDNWTMSPHTSGQHHVATFLDVIRHLPNLRRIQLYTMYHDTEALKAIQEMKLLDHITLWIHPNHQCEEHHAQVNEMIRLANEILAASDSDKSKALLIKYKSEIHIPTSKYRDQWLPSHSPGSLFPGI